MAIVEALRSKGLQEARCQLFNMASFDIRLMMHGAMRRKSS